MKDEKDILVEPGKDEEIPFATLADLCEPIKPKTVLVPTGVGERRIKYMPHLSIDKLQAIQQRHKPRRSKDQVDTGAFLVAIVSAVMINPKIKTSADLRAFRKGASASVVLNIVNEVVDTETFEEIKDGLGEA